MQIFIFQGLGGCAVIVAETREEAMKQLKEYEKKHSPLDHVVCAKQMTK